MNKIKSIKNKKRIIRVFRGQFMCNRKSLLHVHNKAKHMINRVYSNLRKITPDKDIARII